MKATEAKLLEFLKKSPQFVVPIVKRLLRTAEPHGIRSRQLSGTSSATRLA